MSGSRGPHYHYIAGAENLENYKPGGLHPVSVGDKLGERYQVVHKLGHGTYSTIWLVRDLDNDTLVAVKVGKADADEREIRTMSLLNLISPQQESPQDGSVSSAPVTRLLDHFSISGPNGEHSCMVTEPARGSVASAQRLPGGGFFKPVVARAIAAQVALGVHFLHSKGMIHGDLHTGNVLLEMTDDLGNSTDEQVYEQYNPPDLSAVSRVDGQPLSERVPPYVVSILRLGQGSTQTKLPQARIFLTDFGETFSPERETRYDSNVPTVYQPPETFFEPGRPISFATDIWSLGCCMWSILTWGTSPFHNLYGDRDETVREQVLALGPMPRQWWENWDARSQFFSDDGMPLVGLRRRSLSDRFEEFGQQPRNDKHEAAFSPDEKSAILSMFRDIFTYDPRERPTIDEVLRSEWMQNWALPALDRLYEDRDERQRTANSRVEARQADSDSTRRLSLVQDETARSVCELCNGESQVP